MKECINCKTILDDDELFCHECGTRQELQETETQAEETQVEPEGKKCIHCGETIEVDSMFCPFCGKPQEDTKEQEEEILNEPINEETAQEQPTYEWEEEEKSKMWIWIILALLIAAGAGWYFFKDSGDAKPKENYSTTPVEKSIDTTPVVEEKSNEPTTPLAFLEAFYKGNLDDADYIKQHVTASVLNKLKRDYESGCPSGDCLATSRGKV